MQKKNYPPSILKDCKMFHETPITQYYCNIRGEFYSLHANTLNKMIVDKRGYITICDVKKTRVKAGKVIGYVFGGKKDLDKYTIINKDGNVKNVALDNIDYISYAEISGRNRRKGYENRLQNN